MTLLPEERKAKLIAETKQKASAALEDLGYLREVVTRATPCSRAEARRLSPILRRLLLDQDIVRVANPRIGRLHLRMPDNRDVDSTTPYQLFISGGGSASLPACRVTVLEDQQATILTRLYYDRFIDAALTEFLGQRVIFFHGQWITRRLVIRYVAHVASGVHSGTPDKDEKMPFEALDFLQQFALFSVSGGGISLSVAHNALPDSEVFEYNQNAINPILLELISTASLLCNSPDIANLVRCLHEEFNSPVKH